ncbi:MAG: helix-turn-helix transcriptional regulator, partial [Clostridia bacterium]|nr:helix-turn-helix transcriptional regulator [Clostridia bacterium]
LESLGLALDTFYYPESHEKITSLCERIEHHWFGGDDYFSVYFETRMRDLLILLAREKNRNPEPDDSRNMPSDARLHRLRQHLLSSPNLTNYKEENAVSMAQASRSTLFRRYRALFGCSPYEDLQNACIKRGERYLLETNFTVQEISELLGYRSANVFIQRFKRHYGQTPNEWRKKERNAVKTQEERTTP